MSAAAIEVVDHLGSERFADETTEAGVLGRIHREHRADPVVTALGFVELPGAPSQLSVAPAADVKARGERLRIPHYFQHVVVPGDQMQCGTASRRLEYRCRFAHLGVVGVRALLHRRVEQSEVAQVDLVRAGEEAQHPAGDEFLVARRCQAGLGFGNGIGAQQLSAALVQRGHELGLELRVALQPDEVLPHRQHRDRAPIGARQHHPTRGQRQHLVLVAVDEADLIGGRVHPRAALVDLPGVRAHGPAVRGPLHCAAQRMGDHLVPEADAEHLAALSVQLPHKIGEPADPRHIVVDRGACSRGHPAVIGIEVVRPFVIGEAERVHLHARVDPGDHVGEHVRIGAADRSQLGHRIVAAQQAQAQRTVLA